MQMIRDPDHSNHSTHKIIPDLVRITSTGAIWLIWHALDTLEEEEILDYYHTPGNSLYILYT